MTISIGRAWLEFSWHSGRRWCDLHGARGDGWTAVSFTLDLWAFGLQGGIEGRS